MERWQDYIHPLILNHLFLQMQFLHCLLFHRCFRALEERPLSFVGDCLKILKKIITTIWNIMQINTIKMITFYISLILTEKDSNKRFFLDKFL